MREILISDECLAFVTQNSERVQNKFNYLVEVVGSQRIIHKAIIDKITNSKYYELRIKAENQYRIIIFTINTSNFNDSEKIILLNGFLKRTNKDYVKAVKVADKLLKKYKEQL